MSANDKRSRINKFEKRRKNTKAITILIGIGILLLLLLILMFLFGDKSQEKNTDSTVDTGIENEADKDIPQMDASKQDDEDSDELNEENESDTEDKDHDEVITEEIESSDDNVIKAYKGNWKPLGTKQSEPHETNYNDGSQDRIEIEQSIRAVTKLEEDDMIPLWIGNGGEQKIIGTVSNREQSEFYRVYLEWIENKGWQPNKVEVLKENDIN